MFNRTLALTSVALLAVASAVAATVLITGADAEDRQTDVDQQFQQFYGVTPAPEQVVAMADGVVTEGELRDALERGATCLEQAGVQAIRPGHPQLEGNLVLAFFVPEGGDRAAASAALRTCEGQHTAMITAQYRSQLRDAGQLRHETGP